MVDDNVPPPPAGDAHGTAADRLNSWKEIAAYLGKGVRTVQRWENQMGLPVRRLGREGGEIVYALKSEIDAWILKGGHTAADDSAAVTPISTSAPPEPAAPLPAPAITLEMAEPRAAPRPSLFAGGLWVTLFLAALGGIAMTLAQRTGTTSGGPEIAGSTGHPGPNPVGAAVEGHALRVWGEDNRPLWTVRIDAQDERRMDTRIQVGAESPFRPIAVDDLDGDGRNEVLVLAVSASGSGDNLRVFNADGTQRFVHVPGRPVNYGAKTYRGFNSYGLYLCPNADRPPSLFLIAGNVPWFPSVLEEISPTGEIRSEYWSNGYITSVRPATLRGRSLLLVGAYNNESRGASLAILDRERPGGTAPAEKADYRCTNCADGYPQEFLVFPGSDALREVSSGEGSAMVADARVTGETELVVTVSQLNSRVPGETIPLEGSITYTVSVHDLVLRHFLPGWSFLSIHNAFRRSGRLDHAYGPRDEAELAGVLRWSHGRFVPLKDAQEKRRAQR